jgi:hypothetical protein
VSRCAASSYPISSRRGTRGARAACDVGVGPAVVAAPQPRRQRRVAGTTPAMAKALAQRRADWRPVEQEVGLPTPCVGERLTHTHKVGDDRHSRQPLRPRRRRVRGLRAGRVEHGDGSARVQRHGHRSATGAIPLVADLVQPLSCQPWHQARALRAAQHAPRSPHADYRPALHHRDRSVALASVDVDSPGSRVQGPRSQCLMA